MNKSNARKGEGGQSLAEVIIALAIGGILVVGAVTAITVSLRASYGGQALQTGAYLAQELAAYVSGFSKANWRNLADLSRDPASYHLIASGSGFATSTGAENITLNGLAFTRFFTVASTSRDGTGALDSVYVAANEDPSTLRLNVVTSWSIGGEVASSSVTLLLTRHRNFIFSQTDWSGNFFEPAEIISLPNPSYARFATSTNIATSTTGEIFIDGL